MIAAEFEKAICLTGNCIIALKGALLKKAAPPEYIFADLDELPPEMNGPIGDFIVPGGFGRLVNDAFDLPLDGEKGDMHCTKNGQVYICLDTKKWLMLSSVAGVK